jgi:glucose-6-phosphate 1-dehydrogenase
MPLDPKNVVRGQFRGYRNEKGVTPDSQVETFVALKLEIDSWRWKGVPVYIRAGKCLPATGTEVYVELDAPPTLVDADVRPNYWRFRVNPDMSIALGAMIKTPGEKLDGERVELLLSHYPQTSTMGAYERLLGDALKGDATLFAREDSVEAAWRIVEPILGNKVPVETYEPNTWGPQSSLTSLVPPCGWHDPANS